MLKASRDGLQLVLKNLVGIVIELMQDWTSPLLTEIEQDRLVGWHLGVSL